MMLSFFLHNVVQPLISNANPATRKADICIACVRRAPAGGGVRALLFAPPRAQLSPRADSLAPSLFSAPRAAT